MDVLLLFSSLLDVVDGGVWDVGDGARVVEMRGLNGPNWLRGWAF